MGFKGKLMECSMKKVPVLLSERDLEVILRLTNNIAVMSKAFDGEDISVHDGIAVNRKSSVLLSIIRSGKELLQPIDIDGGLSVFKRES